MSHKLIQRNRKLVGWAHLATILGVALISLTLGLAGARSPALASEATSSDYPTPERTGGPPRAIAESVDRGDPVRVIVQLRDDPVGGYINRTLGSDGRTPLTASQANAVQRYADSLAIAQRQFLTQAEQSGIEFQVNRQFNYLFNGVALSIDRRDRKRLEQLPQVEAVHPDYQLQTTLNESVPLIGAPSLWAMTDELGQPVNGQGVRVAILDTGVDYTHPDLGGGIGPAFRVISGYDFVNEDNDPMDDAGHGTHVAGIVAASGTVTGVAPGASLMAYKVCDAAGACFQSAVLSGLERAADPDGDPHTDDAAHVINMSLGGLGTPYDALSRAVNNAVALNMVVVVAGGNRGPDYQTLWSPGVARRALTVAASDKEDGLAAFSSRGPVEGYFDILKPDITAPGVAIYSTSPQGGYTSRQGTSMAAPHVAGAIALMRQLHPDWTPDMLKANLMNTAKDLGLGVHEQGAGRIQLAEATGTPLVATPGSLAFGLPLLEGPTSARLTLVNVSATGVTATASISTALWADGGLTPLATPLPVTYAETSDSDLTIAPGATAVLTVSLNIPADAPPGYYTGKVVLKGRNYELAVPVAFTVLSRVTVHMIDENGRELSMPVGQDGVYIVRVPDVDVEQWRNWQLPAEFYVPPGTYHIYGFAEIWYYEYIRHGDEEQVPLLLATTATVRPNAAHDLYLDATRARRFHLDATTFSGDPLFVREFYASYRYVNGDKVYTHNVAMSYGGKDTELYAPLPASLDFYISDTPENAEFAFASAGYGYSPRLLHFRDLNSAKWYEGPGHQAGFNLTQTADEVYLFEWRFPRIDSSTPTSLGYTPEQVSHYRLKYEVPGTLADPWVWESFDSSGDVSYFLPSGLAASFSPISAGWERSIYLNGVFTHRYYADQPNNHRVFELEFYKPNWATTFPSDWVADIQLASAWDLAALPRQDETIIFGAGPVYPAVTFLNNASMIQLLHPVFGTGRGNKAPWGDAPMLWVWRNGSLVYQAQLPEFWWTPSPMRQVSANEPGHYRIRIASNHDSQVSYNNTIEAGFTLPAADMNPPRMTSFEMPQRFAPHERITATFTVTDVESGIDGVEMLYSLDRGNSWTPLVLQEGGPAYPDQATTFTGTINPETALDVSLTYRITDCTGNYLAFTTSGAALQQTPVTLTVDVSPTVIPLSSRPFTMTLSGTLRRANDEPLSQAALPIAIYLNDRLAGYVRDVARLPNGDFLNGTIGFGWTFIPTDFVSSQGTAELKFVFDLGTYARQEKTFTILFKGHRLFLPVIIRDH